jgi:GntR family transcriptional regulator
MTKKESGITIYRQIADVLKLRIKQQVYKSGDRLPSDRDLSEEFGHNRHTVRRALDILETEQLIVRQHGRGTFVTDISIPQEDRTSLPMGLIDLTKEIGERPSANVLYSNAQTVGKVGHPLKIDVMSNYYVIHRLRLLNDEPLILETIHIPEAIAPNLFIHNLEASLRELLQNTYDVHIVRLDISIESIVSDAYMSKLLEVPIGSPMIFEKRTAYTVAEYVVEYSEHIYRGDRFMFTQEYYKSE